MRYPAYVHGGDDDHAFGAIVPDFPGCFAAADNVNDLEAGVQEAIELYCEGEGLGIPEPSDVGELMKDEQYEGGSWMLVSVDIRKLETRTKRVNISFPVNLLVLVDERRAGLHLSRSAFLAMAAEEKLKGRA